MRQKRILIFATTYYPFIGGAEVAVREIIKRTPDIAFDIVTVNLDGKQELQEVVDQTTVYRIGSGRLGKLLFPIRACFFASRLHKKQAYDAVWSIMASYAGFAGLFFSYRYKGVPFVLTLQEGDSAEELRAKFRLVWPLFKKIIERATRIQAISHYLATFAKSVRSDAPVSVIPNGVSFAEFQRDVEADVARLRKELHKKDGDIFLVTTSRLVKKNAVGDIIESLTHLPENIRLIIVGNGELKSFLEEKAKRQRVHERVHFVGEVSYENILPYLKVSDIFIRPSLSEGFGNSFIEAMASRLPVIATPVGGIVDFLENKKTGLLCDVHNPESIARQVSVLLEDWDFRASIVSNAEEMVQSQYDWDLIATKMQKQVFDVVLSNELKEA